MRLDDDLFPAVRAVHDGDERAFRPLYRTLQPHLTALVGDEAEDVDSETWLHIIRDLPSFTGCRDFLG